MINLSDIKIINNVILYNKEPYNGLINDNGSIFYIIDGVINRENGLPSIEYSDGAKCWVKNNLYHRLDGPAIEYNNGTKYWYYNNEIINCNSQKEFERIIKLFLFK